MQRYRKIIDGEFKGYTKFYIYLSPEGTIPSDDNWIMVKYEIIASLIDDLLANRKDMMNENVYHFIRQYNTILRGYIVGNSEVEQICRQIVSAQIDSETDADRQTQSLMF